MTIQLDQNCVINISSKKDGNMAYHIPLNSNDVQKNRTSFAHKNNLNPQNIVFMEQVHSSDIVSVSHNEIHRCDGLITDNKTLSLAVMVADCIPLFLYDKKNKVIAAVHAGRVGTFNNITVNAVNKLKQDYNSNVGDIIAYIGPSIRSCCYEVSSDIAKIVSKSYGSEFVTNRNIDLQGINRKLLKDQGLLDQNIIIENICTKCNSEQFYSYRKEGMKSGRFVGIISLI